jgi:hypothetical protein
MKKSSKFIDLSPIRREVVSPAEFLRLSKERPHLIARSRFITPVIGRRDFGRFEVHYTVPVYKNLEAA